jgi:DAACS family dicarboxylate/amino acid:cation (Na+ or H+) symporter
VISAVSVVIGLLLANTIRPGKRIDPQTAAKLQERYTSEAQKRVAETKQATAESPVMQFVKSFVPKNPIAAIASDPPNMLQLIFFTVAVGAALLLLPADRTKPLLAALDGLYAISAKIIDLIMLFAPVAVACLLFNNTAQFGLDVLQALLWFIVTVLLGLGLHMFGTYSLAVYWLGGMCPLEFFRKIKTVMATAFSTSSSAATLPTTLRVGEQNLGIPREINSFVLTVGATANQNGTALYEGVSVLFLAQLAGVDLSLGQQIVVAYLAILGGIGTAGVPSGSIPFITIILATVQVNPLLIAIILGVDRILDMCRTTLNVAGDLTAAVYVARKEAVAAGVNRGTRKS